MEERRKVFSLPAICRKDGCIAPIIRRTMVPKDEVTEEKYGEFFEIECSKGHIQYYDAEKSIVIVPEELPTDTRELPQKIPKPSIKVRIGPKATPPFKSPITRRHQSRSWE